MHLEKKIADATIGETAVADAIDVLQTYSGLAIQINHCNFLEFELDFLPLQMSKFHSLQITSKL